MGVIHKLRPEINDYILASKKEKPVLGCRTIADLVYDKFQVKVSKSSINNLIKEAGLSMPVGRRSKRKRKSAADSQNALIVNPIKAVIKIAAESVMELSLQKPQEVLPSAEEKIIPLPEPLIIPEMPAPPTEEKVVEQVAVPEEPPRVAEELPAAPLSEEIIPSQAQVVTVGSLEASGALLLKAADYLVGGIPTFLSLIKARLKNPVADLEQKTEILLYAPLFNLALDKTDLAIESNSPLWSLVGSRINPQELTSYLDDLQALTVLHTDIFQAINALFQLVRGAQIRLFDSSILYLDGQMHTIWSAPQVPHDFSQTIFSLRRQIKDYLQKEGPYILFMAPGYETPMSELFNFLSSLDTGNNRLSRFSLYDHKMEDLETMPVEETKKRYFLFGLWPWQFVSYRKITLLGDFKARRSKWLSQDIFLAEGKLDLKQAGSSEVVSFRCCALKYSLQEKIRLVIVTNYTTGQFDTGDLADLYLEKWPNLEEAFEDYSRKVELFTYTANTNQIFNAETLAAYREGALDLKNLLSYYLKALDLFVRWFILPSGYESKEFSLLKNNFYDLKVVLKEENDFIRAIFQVPAGYKCLKDLNYACRRLNEKQIKFFSGKRIRFCTS